MRVVIAPDSFGGTMSSVQAAAAIAEGWRRVRPDDQIACLPMADGGEGTLDAVLASHPSAVIREAEVADARGVATGARWVTLDEGVSIVETAQAVGLNRLDAAHRDPLRTTSYGVGQLLSAAIAAAPNGGRVVIGLGGSATVDGGAGMLSALTGHGLRRADGNGVKVGGRWVAECVDARGAAHALRTLRSELLGRGVSVTVAADVTSPLLGAAGAAAGFGPQKGASPAAVEELESGLAALADVLERDLAPTRPWRDVPGAGAAGGLGFALACAFGVQPVSGAEVIADLVDGGGVLSSEETGVVITGEGRLDAQTAAGKVADFVRRRAASSGARCLAVAGSVADGADEPFAAVCALGSDGRDAPEAAAAVAAASLAAALGG